MKKPKPKPQSGGLIPRTDEFPQTRKMTESFKENMAIYNFIKHLVECGYMIARKGGTAGQIQVMDAWKTAEFEILRFRGVDRMAYVAEASKLRSMYPHLIEVYGVETEYELPVPEVVDRLEVSTAKAAVPVRGDEEEIVSLAEAWRRGVFTLTPSHSGVRVKMTRCRRFHPDLMPKMIPRGSLTLYRIGDLREWERKYTERCADNQAGVQFSGVDGTRFRDEEQVEQKPMPGVGAMDALAFLLGKIRHEGEEDVR